MANVSTTTILSLILAILGFFTAVTTVTASYYRRNARPSERLDLTERAAETTCWTKRPVIWEVRVDKYPKRTSKWEDLSPLSMTYGDDQSSTRQPPPRQSPSSSSGQGGGMGWRTAGGTIDVQPRPGGLNEEPQPDSATTDCNVSVFIVMPTANKHISTGFGDELAIGTTEVAYHHPPKSRS